MNKRTFLNLLSAAIARPLLAPFSAWAAKQKLSKPQKLTNWAGNLSYSTDNVHEAASVEQIRSVLRSREKVKVSAGSVGPV